MSLAPCIKTLGGRPRLGTHLAYNAKGKAGKADPPGPRYAHRPSTFLNLYNPKRGEVPALQYLQAFSCRNVSCRLSCSCPAHACATVFTSIWLQERVLQTVLQLSCACLRYNIYKHLAAGRVPADHPAAILRMPALQYLQAFGCRKGSCRSSCS